MGTRNTTRATGWVRALNVARRAASFLVRALSSPWLLGLLTGVYVIQRLYLRNMSDNFPFGLAVHTLTDALLFLPRAIIGGLFHTARSGRHLFQPGGPQVVAFARDVLGLEGRIIRQAAETDAIDATRRLVALFPFAAAAQLLGAALVRKRTPGRGAAVRPARLYAGRTTVAAAATLMLLGMLHLHYLARTAPVRAASRAAGALLGIGNIALPLASVPVRLAIRLPILIVRVGAADVSSTADLLYDRPTLLLLHYLDSLSPVQGRCFLLAGIVLAGVGVLLLQTGHAPAAKNTGKGHR